MQTSVNHRSNEAYTSKLESQESPGPIKQAGRRDEWFMVRPPLVAPSCTKKVKAEKKIKGFTIENFYEAGDS